MVLLQLAGPAQAGGLTVKHGLPTAPLASGLRGVGRGAVDNPALEHSTAANPLIRHESLFKRPEPPLPSRLRALPLLREYGKHQTSNYNEADTYDDAVFFYQ